MIHLDRRKRRALRETAAWLVGRRRRIRVVGDSMLPTLEAGNYVLVDPGRIPEVTELAVADHPEQPDLLVIKRVGSITPDGEFYLVSDNVGAGTDSRTWGSIPRSALIGTVTMLLDRPGSDLGGPGSASPPGG